ncbi:Spore germination protein [Paenibacillus sp. yr247]|nr:Spore germination protein [Paenibacillus sp. yr247]
MLYQIAHLSGLKTLGVPYFLFPNLNEHKRVMRRVLGAFVLAAFLLVIVIVNPLMIFGEAAVRTMTYSPQVAIDTVSIEYLPLKKLEFLTPIIWQLLIVFTLGVPLYCATKCLQILQLLDVYEPGGFGGRPFSHLGDTQSR